MYVFLESFCGHLFEGQSWHGFDCLKKEFVFFFVKSHVKSFVTGGRLGPQI